MAVSPPQVLTSHSCSEEGLEDAANVLLQLSRGDGATRDTVLRLLLSGGRTLGATLCRQIGERGRLGVSLSPSHTPPSAQGRSGAGAAGGVGL